MGVFSKKRGPKIRKKGSLQKGHPKGIGIGLESLTILCYTVFGEISPTAYKKEMPL